MDISTSLLSVVHERAMEALAKVAELAGQTGLDQADIIAIATGEIESLLILSRPKDCEPNPPVRRGPKGVALTGYEVPLRG